MSEFRLVPCVAEYAKFIQFAEDAKLGREDLILTNEYIYKPVISDLNLKCQVCFQENFGAGEPTDVMVDKILQSVCKKKYKRIIAVGGGTVIDIAKVLAVADSDDRIDDLFENIEKLEKHHELFIVPTTCGTGSEMTNISIINRTSKGIKIGLVSQSMYADEAVLISEMLMSLPYHVFATSSIDAMIHAVESYLSPKACGFSEMLSRYALHLILQGWQETAADSDEDAWKKHAYKFLSASTYAGIAFGNAGCAAVHALSYPLGSIYHIPHGQANQLMFAAVMQKYKDKKPFGKLKVLEKYIGKELDVKPPDAINMLIVLMDTILEKKKLNEFGIAEDDLPIFAKSVIKTQQRLLINNYVPFTEQDITDIYKLAFN